MITTLWIGVLSFSIGFLFARFQKLEKRLDHHDRVSTQLDERLCRLELEKDNGNGTGNPPV